MTAPAEYWDRRKDLLYYQVVRILAAGLGQDAGSVLDVGSHGSPYLDWFPGIPVRTSLDLGRPYRAEGVTSIVHDFLTWQPDRRYDLVLCLQVLEHIQNATAFAHKLQEAGRIVIVSVPYRWRPGRTKGHLQDPVTAEKLAGWFGRQPDYAHLVQEPATGIERLVCVYEAQPRPWTSLAVREGKHGFRPAKGIPPFGQQPPSLREVARTARAWARRRSHEARLRIDELTRRAGSGTGRRGGDG